MTIRFDAMPSLSCLIEGSQNLTSWQNHTARIADRPDMEVWVSAAPCTLLHSLRVSVLQ